MPELFWQLPHASFGAIQFPVTKVSVKGGARQHTHEYPKSPGGAPEKLGRKLYTISIDAVFDAGLLPPWDENLWPGALSELFDLFDTQVTADLMIPTVGMIKAFCTTWSKEMEVKSMRAGEKAQLEFLEDQSGAFLYEGIINVRTGTMVEQAKRLSAAAAASTKPGIFSAALAALRAIQTSIDRMEMYGRVLEAQVQQALYAFEDLASNFMFDSPANAQMLEDVLAAWEMVLKLQTDLLFQQSNPLVNYITTRDMSVGDVSADYYGNVDQAVNIMRMNDLADPLRIPRNTQLLIYQNAI